MRTEYNYFFGMLLLLTIPFWLPDSDAVVHNHIKAVQYTPNPFKQDSVELCGDSMYVEDNKHINLNEWSRRWIEPLEKPML